MQRDLFHESLSFPIQIEDNCSFENIFISNVKAINWKRKKNEKKKCNYHSKKSKTLPEGISKISKNRI